MEIAKTVMAAGSISNDPAELSDIETLFGNAVSAILGLAGIVLFLTLIVGGFRYITSGGDQQKAQAARGTLTFAIIGLVVIFMSFFMINIIETLFGINLLSFSE